ncbi:MAG: hypothetical protein NNA22_07555 [Nitrospira sp.]|nr:hypothetical protein [Nitrospira sp.]
MNRWMKLGATAIHDVLIRHKCAKRRHAILLFRHLLASIAQVRLAVETEPTASVRGRQPDLFSRQQRSRISQITQREWTRAAFKADMKNHFDPHRLPVLRAHLGRKDQSTT